MPKVIKVSNRIRARMARDYKNGLSFAEISQKYKVSRGTARKLIYEYAREKKDGDLQKLLKKKAHHASRKPYKSTGAAERLYDTYLALGYSSHEAIQAINKIYEKHNNQKEPRNADESRI